MQPVKKIVSIVLVGLVLVFTVIAILGIWNVINLEEVMTKILKSLLIIFAASAVILFIISVFIKEDQKKEQ